MRTRGQPSTRSPRPRRARALLLVECVVYIGVLLVVMNAAGVALIAVLDHFRALRHQSEQVTGALTAGERWRADVRAASVAVGLTEVASGTELRLVGLSNHVAYSRQGAVVYRRAGPDGAWQPVLGGVRETRFIDDGRSGVAAWRWELTLEPRRIGKRPPLQFTFQAAVQKDSGP